LTSKGFENKKAYPNLSSCHLISLDGLKETTKISVRMAGLIIRADALTRKLPNLNQEQTHSTGIFDE
jgi:hypothetical protein